MLGRLGSTIASDVHMVYRLYRQMPSTWLVAREIVRNDGFGTRGLAKGFHATVLRNGMFNGVYFGSYYNMKHFLPPEVHELHRVS